MFSVQSGSALCNSRRLGAKWYSVLPSGRISTGRDEKGRNKKGRVGTRGARCLVSVQEARLSINVRNTRLAINCVSYKASGNYPVNYVQPDILDTQRVP